MKWFPCQLCGVETYYLEILCPAYLVFQCSQDTTESFPRQWNPGYRNLLHAGAWEERGSRSSVASLPLCFPECAGDTLMSTRHCEQDLLRGCCACSRVVCYHLYSISADANLNRASHTSEIHQAQEAQRLKCRQFNCAFAHLLHNLRTWRFY